MTTEEVQRVENWESGELQCLRCGATFRLYYNGGELDSHTCCGYTYRTEHVRTDLVIRRAQ